MPQKIHMHDQVFNKVDDIMNHYKRKPIGELMQLLKQLMKKSSVIWWTSALALALALDSF